MVKETEYNGIKIKNIFPFYVDNVNNRFFENFFSNYNSRFIVKTINKIKKKLNDDEREKFNEIENLTKSSKILLMLNLALCKIVSKTGSKTADLFEVISKNKLQENQYISNLQFHNDLYTKDNQAKWDKEHKYDFYILINEKSYLKKYLSNLQLSFFLDVDSELLAGGISLNSEYLDCQDYNKIIDKIYFHTLVKHFISKQLFPLSLENIITIISNNNEEFQVQNYQQKNKKQQTTLTIDTLQQNWAHFITKKYLRYKNMTEKENKFYTTNLFFAVLIINLVNLTLYEELKIYFTNKNPEIILKLLGKPEKIKEDPNQNILTDFYELAKFLNQNYLLIHKNIKFKKIKNAQDLIKALNFQAQKYLDFSFGKPILSVEIYQKKTKIQYSNPIHLFENNLHLKMLFLLVIFPEIFGMDSTTANFIDYQQFLSILQKQNLNVRKITIGFKEIVNQTLCEFNYEITSFIGDEPSMLIIKNNTTVKNHKLYSNDQYQTTGLYENYLWSQIFIQSRLLKKRKIEKNKDVTRKNIEKKIQQLEKLSFNWYDDYYGIDQLKVIINKIEKQTQLKQTIENLRLKLIQENELLKKDTERRTILLAYIVASLIGFINFFGMIYTVLTVTDPSKGVLLVENIIVITIGSVFAAILFFILLFFGWKIYRNLRVSKKN